MHIRSVASLVLTLGAPILAVAAGPAAAPSKFSVATIRFEQNATDGDVEVVFEISGRKDGLAQLKVVAPNGRTVIDFSAPAASPAGAAKHAAVAGIRQFVFESPEPTDIAGLKASYPAGEYSFTGTTVGGAQLQSKATLNHALPAITSFVAPKEDAEDVASKNLTIKWAPVKGVAGYALELSHEESNAGIEVRLPASATSFAVPDGFLVSGQTYQLGIGTVSADGNVSYIETEFRAAGDK